MIVEVGWHSRRAGGDQRVLVPILHHLGWLADIELTGKVAGQLEGERWPFVNPPIAGLEDERGAPGIDGSERGEGEGGAVRN